VLSKKSADEITEFLVVIDDEDVSGSIQQPMRQAPGSG
jgi:hypothetical protein